MRLTADAEFSNLYTCPDEAASRITCVCRGDVTAPGAGDIAVGRADGRVQA